MKNSIDDIKDRLIYEGKAKKLYSIKNNAHEILVEFKDSLTAFNAQKLGSFTDKGSVNMEISNIIYSELVKHNISTHFVKSLDANHMIVKKLSMLPLEVVVRNVVAGSLAKKLDIPEGRKLKSPIVEFYYKSDSLGDPFLSTEQIIALDIASEADVRDCKQYVLKINEILLNLFSKAKINLIDFKVEFGRDQNSNLLLADEISPDCMRLWDQITNEKLDKDRFRRDLGNVEGAYREVLHRLKK